MLLYKGFNPIMSNRGKESPFTYSLSKVSVPECWKTSRFYLFILHSAVNCLYVMFDVC